MKPSPTSYLYQQEMMEEQSALAVGMEVDDADPLDVLGDPFEKPVLDSADFFNSFEDDFDDSDVA